MNLFIGFFSSIALARSLGPSARGELSFFLLLINTLSEYSPVAILHSMPYFLKRTDYSEKKVLSVDYSYIVFISVIVSAGLVLFKCYSSFLSSISFFQLILGIFLVLVQIHIKFVTLFLVANENFLKSNWSFTVTNFIQQSLILLMWGLNILSITNYILVFAGATLFYLISIKKVANIKVKYQMDLLLLKKQFYYGIYVYLGALFGSMFYRIDQFMIKEFLSYRELGVYVIAVGLAEKVLIIPDSITNPLMGKLLNEESPQSRIMNMERSIKITFFVILVIFIISFFVSNYIVFFYGSDYVLAKNSFIFVMVGTFGASIGKVSYPFVLYLGKPFIHAYITFITLAINVILNFFFIPKAGISGAALATAASYSVYGAAYIIVLCRNGHNFSKMFIVSKHDLQIVKSYAMKALGKFNGSR